MIKVIVADDHGVVRDGFCRLLNSEEDIEVVGEAADGREAVELCKKLKPNIIVMDYEMPNMDGLEATRRIVELKLGAKILILTIFDKKEFALTFIKSGASGYLCKKISGLELPLAVRKVAAGDIYFSASYIEPESFRDNSSGDKDFHFQLSDREYQIFIRMARGMTMTETAEDLHISYSTVKTFKYSLMRKLDLKKNSDITFYAINKGLIKKDE